MGGDVSLVRFHSGLLGVGHRIDAVSMSFRYQTGFTGADKKAPIVRPLLLDADNNEQCLNIPLDDLASGFNARVNWAANDSVDQLWANPEPGIYALAMALESGQRKLLLVSKTA